VIVRGPERDGGALTVLTLDVLKVKQCEVVEVTAIDRREEALILLREIVLPAAEDFLSNSKSVSVHLFSMSA
jgi:hypothetical protein